jgi:hypothetical protein
MVVLLEVYQTGNKIATKVDFSERVEGTPQFCSGYMAAVKNFHIGREVIKTVLEK